MLPKTKYEMRMVMELEQTDMLDDRKEKILKAIIANYLETGEPVCRQIKKGRPAKSAQEKVNNQIITQKGRLLNAKY